MNLKTIIICLVSLMLPLYVIARGCFDYWTADYLAAQEEYLTDMEKCGGKLPSAKCKREANLDYGKSVDEAADNYYRCVGYY